MSRKECKREKRRILQHMATQESRSRYTSAVTAITMPCEKVNTSFCQAYKLLSKIAKYLRSSQEQKIYLQEQEQNNADYEQYLKDTVNPPKLPNDPYSIKQECSDSVENMVLDTFEDDEKRAKDSTLEDSFADMGLQITSNPNGPTYEEDFLRG
ncbi:hypothetical protein GOV14_03820 [Candidatus Pacearchaeota archaeon]|nr:hypothetical protein [Candidatus Pacearchaeota archaeon]